MRIAMIALSVVMFSACMPQVDAPIMSLEERQPMVLSVDPLEDAVVATTAPVKLSFSLPIDPASVDSTAVAIMEKPEDDEDKDIAEKVIDGDAEIWKGEYTVSEDGKEISFIADSSYLDGSAYAIVVTKKLMSAELVPFNQTPGSNPTPFISTFVISGDGGGGSAGGSGGGGGDGTEEAPKIRPAWLVISEVLYDIPGADNNGDAFIELAGEAGTEISGYELAFVNGADGRIYDTVKIPDGSMIPADNAFVIADAITGSPGSSHVELADHVINFDPQNGPDAIQLLDDAGKLVDVVGYGGPIVELAENGLVSYEGSPTVDVGSGMSIARVDTFDTDDNSLDFIQRETPSPGVIELVHE